ncbi:MAG: hypothetical protein R8G66_05630 [Cytophagales bacterium]|nr:hypothetical protein [Cytophagales bacterium]
MNYKTLFDISFLHNFFVNGMVGNMSILPTEETSTLLKNLKMIFKSDGGGERVLYRTFSNTATPFVEEDGKVQFVFTLCPQNTATFQNITNLNQGSPSKAYGRSKIPFFENDGSAASNDPDVPEEIRHVLLDALRPKVFTYSYTLDPVPVPEETILKVTGPDGTVETIEYNETSEMAPDSSGLYNVPIDFGHKVSGKYTFTVRNQADDTDLLTEILYLDNVLNTQNPQGIIQITYDPADDHLYGTPEYYGITFIRKQSKWKYYVANKNGNVDLSSQILILDDDSDDDTDMSNPYDSYNFTKGDVPDPNIAINGYETVVFTSLEDIPFYERPKLHLNLKVDGDVVIENLPNPPLAGVCADVSEIFVFL